MAQQQPKTGIVQQLPERRNDVVASALLAIHNELLELRRDMRTHSASVGARLDQGDKRMERLTVELATNTELTREFAAAREGARMLRTVMVWAGGIAGGAVGIWQLVKMLLGGNGDIGPTP